MMNVGYHSLWGVLILAGDIWAIINILQSSASNEKKLIWTIERGVDLGVGLADQRGASRLSGPVCPGKRPDQIGDLLGPKLFEPDQVRELFDP